jgi:hypothetical protein
MKLQLSLNACVLLKETLAFTGEKEINAEGKEVPSARRLSGEEAAQRRHFIKAFSTDHENLLKEFKEKNKTHIELVNKKKDELKKETPKTKGEKEEDYDKRLTSILNNDKELIDSFEKMTAYLRDESIKKREYELTDKTVEVVKKYYKDYSEKYGFETAQDEVVEEIDLILK